MSVKKYGFRAKKVYRILDTDINFEIQALDSKRPEISKAFDAVCHKRFLHKIKYYGLREKMYKIIEIYFDNRIQYVNIDVKFNDPKTVTCGIPLKTDGEKFEVVKSKKYEY